MKVNWRRMLMLILAMMLVLSGCGKGNSDKNSTGAAENSTEAETLAPPIEVENVFEYVTLGQYFGVEAEKESAEVTDKEIENAINAVLKQKATKEKVHEGTIAEGDIAGIEYVGKLDGVAFEGGTGSYDLEIGSNSFIDGFEDGLIGVQVGETVDLNLTFPENYKSKELAGKAVVFTVKVNYKVELILPELNDELAKALKYESAEKMKEEIIKKLKEEKATTVENNYFMNVWDVVIKNCEIKKHEEIYKEYYTSFVGPYEDMAEAYNMKIEDLMKNYYGVDYQEFLKVAEEYATSCMNQELVCRAIIEQEKITASEEEYAEELNELYETYKSYFKTKEDIETYYGKDRLMLDIKLQKAIDIVVEKAVPVEPSTEEATEESTEGK